MTSGTPALWTVPLTGPVGRAPRGLGLGRDVGREPGGQLRRQRLRHLPGARRGTESRHRPRRARLDRRCAHRRRRAAGRTSGRSQSPSRRTGRASCAAEGYAHAFARSYGLGTVALRFANVYGPWSARKKGAMTLFFRAIDAGEPIVIYGDGSASRDYTHVDDICRALQQALESDVEGGTVLHIASGVETTVQGAGRPVPRRRRRARAPRRVPAEARRRGGAQLRHLRPRPRAARLRADDRARGWHPPDLGVVRGVRLRRSPRPRRHGSRS